MRIGGSSCNERLTMPPYGNDGGNTSTSNTPKRYGGRIFSAVIKNLAQETSAAYSQTACHPVLPVDVLLELPVGRVNELGLCPDACMPFYAFYSWERLVYDVPSCESNQIGRYCYWLR